MNGDPYERLASALDRLPNGFPRTESNVELRLLRRVFNDDEAEVAAALTGRPASAVEVVHRVCGDVVSVEAILESLAKRSLIWTSEMDDEPLYRLAPFMPVGFFEAHLLESRDAEFAHLVEEYFRGGGARGIMSPQPAIHRVLPARGATEIEWVLPYDDVRAILETATSFRLEACTCRLQQEEIGQRRCDFPLDACLWFSHAEAAHDEDGISREQALAVLDNAERVGLVHTVSNVAEGIGYVCNCCGCCCALLRGINEWGIRQSVAEANYVAEIDPDKCRGCGTCSERCQVDAISVGDDQARVVLRTSCIGCGLCVTGCPADAARLRRKPEHEIVPPPDNATAWERLRLHGRGLEQD
jgi:Na+-translocating ferredoxin:NAD+ oxidoreductase subunit B